MSAIHSDRTRTLRLVARDPNLRVDRTLDWSACMTCAQGGDADAYRRLLVDVTPYLRSLAAKRMHNRSDIEDVVQDVLLTVHTARHTYDPVRPFGPWLTAIANRRIVDALRRQGRATAHETPLESEHETFAAPATNIDEHEQRALRDAVKQLPKSQREAIVLMKLKELSLREAASATGMSVSALKVATHRAIRKLHTLLASGRGKS